jgi:hypothetical protein
MVKSNSNVYQYTTMSDDLTYSGTVTIPTVSIPTVSIPTYTFDNNIIDAGSLSTGSDLTIRRDGKPSIKVAETLETILDRMLILQPNFEKMEQYPALKQAYDNYKMIEALIANDSDKK